MNWQPISTAPKETALLLATEFFGKGDWRIKCGSFYDGEWHVWGASWTPSHWMPLPAAPGKERPAALNLEAAAMKLAEVFDYPWEDMPAEGRQNMRKNTEAVLLAAGIKNSP